LNTFVQFLCLAAGLLMTMVCHGVNTVTAVVDEDIIADYQLFVGDRDPIDIDFYGGPGARRDVVEIVLLQQALHLGGFNTKIVFRPERSYLRIIKLVADGQVPLSATLKWRDDIKPYSDYLYKSSAVVKEGEFIAGIYTRPDNAKALAATSLDKIRELTAASNNHWKADVSTLKQLGIQRIYYSTYWGQIVRMVVAGRADITLAPFQSNPDMKVLFEGSELVPIPGIKVALPGSRHWAVSKKHPQGKEIFTALQKGISILEHRKIIQRAYEESGFFHQGVEHWKLLNPSSSQ
jgi:hypothetical protein